MENWNIEDRMPFFRAIEEEIVKAKMSDKVIYIQIDANSKLGPEWITGDPHKQSANGKFLGDILKRNALTVINSLPTKCSGLITRSRITKKVKEISIIDFVIGCEEMSQMINSLVIDEEKKYVLTKFTKTKNGMKIQESDHNSLITNINATWHKKRNIKPIEMYDLKDQEGLKKFKAMTSKDNFLSEVFQEEEKNIEVKTKQFLKRLGFCISQSFKKIRITNTKKNKYLEGLFNKRRILRQKKDEKSLGELNKVELSLSTMCAEDNFQIVQDACAGLSCEKGGVNAGKLWKLKKRLRGIVTEPPTAMLDSRGNLVTTSSAIEALTMEMYQDRLKAHNIKEHLTEHKVQREKMCDERLKEASQIKTHDWTMGDLEEVLKQLKLNKSRDPMGYSNELFTPNNAGTDLKKAVLKLMNQIKTQQIFPQPLKKCNISSLYKHKGSKHDFNNYRGIFRVTILRSILDKPIYNDEYCIIDENLTDSNVGARKGRNIRDNIFVVSAIVNNVVRRKLKGIDIGIYDIEKCFDKLWSKECINDLYENGLKNDKLCLLHLANSTASVAIKT